MRVFVSFIVGVVVGLALFLLMRHLIAQPPMPGTTPTPTVILEAVRPDSELAVKQPQSKMPQPPEAAQKPEGPAVEATEETHLPPIDTEGLDPKGPAVVVDLDALPPGGGVPGGQALCTVMVAPVYPYDAVHGNIEGSVELEFSIQADGSVADISVIRADPPGYFEQAARRAVARWRCTPRHDNGEPVAQRVRQVLRFTLDKNQ